MWVFPVIPGVHFQCNLSVSDRVEMPFCFLWILNLDYTYNCCAVEEAATSHLRVLCTWNRMVRTEVHPGFLTFSMKKIYNLYHYNFILIICWNDISDIFGSIKYTLLSLLVSFYFFMWLLENLNFKDICSLAALVVRQLPRSQALVYAHLLPVTQLSNNLKVALNGFCRCN